MRIGPEIWHWVSINTAGVPTGGVRYGNVRRFIQSIARYGWKLAWHDIWKCFILYTQEGRTITPQWWFFNHRTQVPVPVSDEWVRILRYLQVNRPDAPTMERAFQQVEAQTRCEEAQERERELDDGMPEAVDESLLNLGLRTPRLSLVMPGVG